MRGEQGTLSENIHILNVRQPNTTQQILTLGVMPNGDYVCLLQLARGTKDECEAMFFGDDFSMGAKG